MMTTNDLATHIDYMQAAYGIDWEEYWYQDQMPPEEYSNFLAYGDADANS